MLGSEALDMFLRMVQPGANVLNVGDASDSPANRKMIDAGMSVRTVSLVDGADIVCHYQSICSPDQDAIWCSHVLEHQRNSGQFLDKIFDDLKPGGVLAITVPPAKDQLAGGHCTIWNATTLIYSLILAGFDCSSAWVKRYQYNISVVVEKKRACLPKLVSDYPDREVIKSFFPDGYDCG